MWTSRFKKQYRNLDPNTQQGGVEAIREIVSSVNPASLGTYKPNMGVFAYEIGGKYRIIYSIQYRTESWICFGHVIASPHTARSKGSQRTSIRKCSVTCLLAVYLFSGTYADALEAFSVWLPGRECPARNDRGRQLTAEKFHQTNGINGSKTNVKNRQSCWKNQDLDNIEVREICKRI